MKTPTVRELNDVGRYIGLTSFKRLKNIKKPAPCTALLLKAFLLLCAQEKRCFSLAKFKEVAKEPLKLYVVVN